MAGIGLQWPSGADVDEQRAPLASGFGHGGGKILLGVRQRLECTILDPYDDQAVLVQPDSGRSGLYHWEAGGEESYTRSRSSRLRARSVHVRILPALRCGRAER